MLLQIGDYIRRERLVSTQQLSREFCIDLAALEPMLDIWVRKGVIIRCEQGNQCKSSCFKCRTPPQYYTHNGSL